MRVLSVVLLFVYALYAKNVEIVKYLSNNKKPMVEIEFQNNNSKIENLMKNDFSVIGHFDYKFLPKISNYNSKINYANYSKTDYLVRYNYLKNKLYVLIYDIKKQKRILNKVYKIPNFKYYPFMVHTFSYDLNKKLKMPNVAWIKRMLVYSVYTAPKESEIYISDYSLHFKKKLIQGGLNIFPKWANKEQTKIYYTSFDERPTLYEFNIYTGQKERLLSSSGMLIVSDVKGNNLLLTMAIDDQPDIYLFNIKTKQYKQLTHFQGIDVSGKFYGNNSIAFISNRIGTPYVYEKSFDSNNVTKILNFGKNQIGLSAFKNKIVISSRESSKMFSRNTFNLFLSKKNDFVIKRLTFNGKNMYPKFSNDGSTIIFIKDFHFSSKIGIIRLKENLLFYYPISKKLQSLDW